MNLHSKDKRPKYRAKNYLKLPHYDLPRSSIFDVCSFSTIPFLQGKKQNINNAKCYNFTH